LRRPLTVDEDLNNVIMEGWKRGARLRSPLAANEDLNFASP
jgi:hypothetical protein